MFFASPNWSLPEWLHAVAATAPLCPSDADKVAFAIALALRNIEENTGGPFGSAVFDEQGQLVAAGVNRVVPNACSIQHAEIVALSLAQARVNRHRLNDDGRRYTLATSAQPCCQCYGACVWAGIDQLLIGARAEDVMALSEFDEGPLPADWVGELERRRIQVRRDILRDEARAVFTRYAEQGGTRY